MNVITKMKLYATSMIRFDFKNFYSSYSYKHYLMKLVDNNCCLFEGIFNTQEYLTFYPKVSHRLIQI